MKLYRVLGFVPVSSHAALDAGPFGSRRQAEEAATAAVATGHRRGTSVESYSEVRIVEDDTDDDNGTLHDYRTGDPVRPATAAELKASLEAGPEGVIQVDGRSCYVRE